MEHVYSKSYHKILVSTYYLRYINKVFHSGRNIRCWPSAKPPVLGRFKEERNWGPIFKPGGRRWASNLNTLILMWLFLVSHISSRPVEIWVTHIETQLNFYLSYDSTLGTHPSTTYLGPRFCPWWHELELPYLTFLKFLLEN